MKIMMFITMLLVAYIAFHTGDNDNERPAEVSYNAERHNEQDKILVELQSLNDKSVSQFVKDWTIHASNPTPEQLTELRLIRQNIKNDPVVAEKYTIQWKEKNTLCGQAKSLFGKGECVAGL